MSILHPWHLARHILCSFSAASPTLPPALHRLLWIFQSHILIISWKVCLCMKIPPPPFLAFFFTPPSIGKGLLAQFFFWSHFGDVYLLLEELEQNDVFKADQEDWQINSYKDLLTSRNWVTVQIRQWTTKCWLRFRFYRPITIFINVSTKFCRNASIMSHKLVSLMCCKIYVYMLLSNC